MNDIEESLRRADFSREREGLEERLWRRVVQGIAAAEGDGERELTEEELLQIAAAGTPHVRPDEKV